MWPRLAAFLVIHVSGCNNSARALIPRSGYGTHVSGTIVSKTYGVILLIVVITILLHDESNRSKPCRTRRAALLYAPRILPSRP